jgi:hypothetical protein
MAMADEEGWFERLTYTWWGYFVLSLIFAVFSLFIYWHISWIESQGGGRVWWLLALVYSWAGKIGTVLVCAVPAAIFAITGVVKFLHRNEE